MFSAWGETIQYTVIRTNKTIPATEEPIWTLLTAPHFHRTSSSLEFHILPP